MTVGIEIYRDGAGSPFFGSSIAAGLILGGVDLTVGHNSGVISDANLDNGIPFYYLIGENGIQQEPVVVFTSGTLTYSDNPDGNNYTGRLVYGIR